MKVHELFESDVTRDIPPVVYFHEQLPEKLAAEVREYIITGGYPNGHPDKSRVPNGIHEQYVNLLTAIVAELEKPGGPELPASWISGFYGSGKSSFAKLLGLALDGVALPDGRSLAEAWLARDTSPSAKELRAAYKSLRTRIDPIAVVFDIGSAARDGEQIHSAVVRQIQQRLGYCHQPHVAEAELRLERDGQWSAFTAKAHEVLGRPWSEASRDAMADDQFSEVMHALYPTRFTDGMAWLVARAGTHTYALAVEEATLAIADMLKLRAQGKTLFLVIDEISQYIDKNHDRMLRLQTFVSDLGQKLRGKVWLLVTGQQKLEEGGDQSVLGKMKDRFPEKLRVHLSVTNIRDVVHKRLLHKSDLGVRTLRPLLSKHRNDLRLFAYGCDNETTEEDLLEVYPLLPGYIDLILQITSALRTRSSRSQGDDQAIRGLLQLLGELFRSRKLAAREVGTLVTLDEVYEVQHTALESDIQGSMARVLNHCATHKLELAARAAKTVALLELIQDSLPTDAKLVARCLYDRLDRGSSEQAVQEALEELRRHNLLGYSEKTGYKIQSSSGEEWERDRSDLNVTGEDRAELIQDALEHLTSEPEQPRLEGRPFPLLVLFSDGRSKQDVHVRDPRDPASLTVDFRHVTSGEQDPAGWTVRSAESGFKNRIIWLSGDVETLIEAARECGRSARMIKVNKARRESLTLAKQRLLIEEESRYEELHKRLYATVAETWLSGTLYFAGGSYAARELGSTFGQALSAICERVLPKVFAHFVATRITPAEMLQLLDEQLSHPTQKLVKELGILKLEAGKYEPTCDGVVPRRVLEFIEQEKGASGAALQAAFGGPPYGYAPEVVRACVAGFLRARRIRIQPEAGQALSSVRDAGILDVFQKDRGFKNAQFLPAGEAAFKPQDLARVCKFFDSNFQTKLDREPDRIADAVAQHFPAASARLRDVFTRLRKLPDSRSIPYVMVGLDEALTTCAFNSRYTEPTLRACLKHLDVLQDGMQTMRRLEAELDDQAVHAVRLASDVAEHQLAQLEAIEGLDSQGAQSAARVREQLAGERPWREIASIEVDLAVVQKTYVARRRELLQQQEQAAEAARRGIKAREGFATLTAEHSHHVLRPIGDALAQTDDLAVSPPLLSLRDGYLMALQRAEEEANMRLDALLSAGPKPIIRTLDLSLKNREIRDAEELEQLLSELRVRILEQLKTGRVRLL
jgi:hypothetical protein